MTAGEPSPAGEESANERLTRNVNELLAELRVAQAGVQILFGFLLAVVFTNTFRDAGGFEKGLHLVTVLLSATSTALLTSPAVWHRVLFREGKREDILRVGNRLVVAGLACLAAAVTLTVALITKVVFGWWAMGVVAVVLALLFGTLWFVLPRRMSRADTGRRG
jgi:O-antigen/teichoic acid export membrane protein